MSSFAFWCSLDVHGFLYGFCVSALMSLYLLFLAGSVLFILAISWLSLFRLCMVGLKISTSLHVRAHGLLLVLWLVAA
jgi:hypothetical protein